MAGAQPSATTSLGPIDPTTGEPYALEALGNNANGSNAQNSGPTSLQQELSDLGQIETLLAGISQVNPVVNQVPSVPFVTTVPPIRPGGY